MYQFISCKFRLVQGTCQFRSCQVRSHATLYYVSSGHVSVLGACQFISCQVRVHTSSYYVGSGHMSVQGTCQFICRFRSHVSSGHISLYHVSSGHVSSLMSRQIRSQFGSHVSLRHNWDGPAGQLELYPWIPSLLQIVGNLLYYRYINSAIVAPDAFDIVNIGAEKALSPDQRRNLGSIAKILQFAASNKGVGARCCHLAPLVKSAQLHVSLMLPPFSPQYVWSKNVKVYLILGVFWSIFQFCFILGVRSWEGFDLCLFFWFIWFFIQFCFSLGVRAPTSPAWMTTSDSPMKNLSKFIRVCVYRQYCV